MAHPYSTETRLRLFAAGKGERLVSLLDRNFDGVADVIIVGASSISVLSATLERAANRIDSRLGAKYAVPFSTTTPTAPDDTPTYGVVADLCDLYALARLALWVDPQDVDGREMMQEFEDEIAALLTSNAVIPGAALITTSTNSRSWGAEALPSSVCGATTDGRTDSAYTDDSLDQSRGI